MELDGAYEGGKRKEHSSGDGKELHGWTNTPTRKSKEGKCSEGLTPVKSVGFREANKRS
jgi:hypothetical protein